jgi:hypothetical protein
MKAAHAHSALSRSGFKFFFMFSVYRGARE